MKTFKIIFAGTPHFSVAALTALLHSPHDIVAVYTQPDRPAGRGRQVTASPVKQLALQQGLPVYQPVTLKHPEEQAQLKAFAADLMIVIAYGLLLPLPVLQTPALGCLNVHASLLPRWRGAAPIQRALLAGDQQTGITIMQMDAGLDTGTMLYKAECPILTTDTSESLHDKLASLGAKTLLASLDQLSQLTPEIQNADLATYAKKLTKEEALINWNESADIIERKIRAFNPWPVAYTLLNGQTIRIWQATLMTHTSQAAPGTIISLSAQGILVATRDAVIQLQKLQLSGGKILTAAEILNARRDEFAPGKKFT